MSAPDGFSGISPALRAAWIEAADMPLREDAPDDYLTRGQLEALWGVAQSTASERIRRLQRAGRIATGWRKRQGGWSPVYRLLEEKP